MKPLFSLWKVFFCCYDQIHIICCPAVDCLCLSTLKYIVNNYISILRYSTALFQFYHYYHFSVLLLYLHAKAFFVSVFKPLTKRKVTPVAEYMLKKFADVHWKKIIRIKKCGKLEVAKAINTVIKTDCSTCLNKMLFLNCLRPEEMQYSNILNGFCGLGNDL